MFPPSAIVAPNSAIINTTSYPTQRPNILPGTCLLVSGERLQMLNVGANKISKGRPGWKGDARASMPRPPTWHLFLQCYLYYVLSSSHVWMWELDHKAGWVLKNWCFWIVVLEKTLESPLDCKEIKPVNPRGNQHYGRIGRIDAEAETPILWTPDVKSWFIGKEPDAVKDWRLKEKREAEDEVVGWHLRLNGYEFEQTLEHRERWGSLACCSPWGCRVGHDLASEQQQQFVWWPGYL